MPEATLAPLGDDDEEGEINIKDDEDVEKMKIAVDPQMPSPQEVESHRLIHLPFRNWCKWCIMGRGRGLQHRGCSASTIAVIGLDYFFITRGGVKKRDELEYGKDDAGEAALNDARSKGEVVKCILVRCMKSKNLFAHCIPQKGAGEERYVAKLVVTDVEWLGHTKAIIKSDNEPALQTLITQSL